MQTAIIGATGFTGMELIRILLRHSKVKLTHLTTRQPKPIPVRALIPAIPEGVDLEICPYDFAKVKREADVVFVCLPHTEAMSTVQAFRKAGKIVIVLSADYRFQRVRTYEEWYGVKHRYPELLREAVYGIPELFREEIEEAKLIANPGCYPTGVILALAPLLKRKLIKFDPMIVDSKSGVTGAGKKLNAATQFSELDENFYAYKVNRHQHMPEMVEVLRKITGDKISLTFVPHLLPVKRGILSTLYLERRKGVSSEKIRQAFSEAYDGESFVRIKPEGVFPALKDVQNTNFCDLGISTDRKTGRVIVVSAIDNLLKGASGQAVQNMNICCGFPEEEGLRTW